MSVEPERIRALDGATKQLLWDRMIASKQTVSSYVVMLDSGSLETMELSAAQAEGFECLTCEAQCSRGAGTFVPVGRIPSVGIVFQCIACSVGVR